MFCVCTQGTEAEQRAHSQQSVNNHLEMSVEHTAQTELDVVRLRGQTEVLLWRLGLHTVVDLHSS